MCRAPTQLRGQLRALRGVEHGKGGLGQPLEALAAMAGPLLCAAGIYVKRIAPERVEPCGAPPTGTTAMAAVRRALALGLKVRGNLGPLSVGQSEALGQLRETLVAPRAARPTSTRFDRVDQLAALGGSEQIVKVLERLAIDGEGRGRGPFARL